MTGKAAEQQSSAPRQGNGKGTKSKGTSGEAPEGGGAPPGTPPNSVARRTTQRIADRGFCPVPTYFLQHYHRLPPPRAGQKELAPNEVLLLIHLLDHKWTEAHPFPSSETLAKRLGVSTRMVRKMASNLEDWGLIQRIIGRRRTNRYDMSGLFQALERLIDQDESKARGADSATEAAA